MKIRFLFLVILLSCSVVAQEESAPVESEPDGAMQQGEEPREEQTDNESGEQGEESGNADGSPGDFRPSQEISEDYPVPLPADI